MAAEDQVSSPQDKDFAEPLQHTSGGCLPSWSWWPTSMPPVTMAPDAGGPPYSPVVNHRHIVPPGCSEPFQSVDEEDIDAEMYEAAQILLDLCYNAQDSNSHSVPANATPSAAKKTCNQCGKSKTGRFLGVREGKSICGACYHRRYMGTHTCFDCRATKTAIFYGVEKHEPVCNNCLVKRKKEVVFTCSICGKKTIGTKRGGVRNPRCIPCHEQLVKSRKAAK